MADLFPAKTVTIVKVHYATCNLDWCTWQGPNRASHAEANPDRDQHLTWHRLAADETEPRDA